MRFFWPLSKRGVHWSRMSYIGGLFAPIPTHHWG